MADYPKQIDWTIYQGRTFQYVLRWDTDPMVYKAITAISRTAPAQLTVPGHGLASGWYAAVTDVVGMTEINAQSNAPRTSDYRQVTVVDVDTISFNDLSTAGFSAYVSGGYLRYRTPKSLAGAVARMDIRDHVGGTLLHAASSTGGEIVLDDTNHTITVVLSDVVTAAMTYRQAVYDLEVVALDGTVSVLLAGNIELIPEVTTSV